MNFYDVTFKLSSYTASFIAVGAPDEREAVIRSAVRLNQPYESVEVAPSIFAEEANKDINKEKRTWTGD